MRRWSWLLGLALLAGLPPGARATVAKPSEQAPRPPRRARRRLAAHRTGRPDGIGPDQDAAVGDGGQLGVSFWGGPVLSTATLYYIWYGDWSPRSKAVLTRLGRNLGETPLYGVLKRYGVSNVGFGPSTTDLYSRGKALKDSDVREIVASAIAASSAPADANGVYMVLTARDVGEMSDDGKSGFCIAQRSGGPAGYAGWHSHAVINGVDVKYAFIGDPALVPQNCWVPSVSPNRDPEADVMAPVVEHELAEAVTDPDLDAWFGDGGEIGDACAWKFGMTRRLANGARYNVLVGGKPYLLQALWTTLDGGYCAFKQQMPPPFIRNASSALLAENRAFTFRVRASWKPSGGYEIDDLPADVVYNGFTGRVFGRISKVGVYPIELSAIGRDGIRLKWMDLLVHP